MMMSGFNDQDVFEKKQVEAEFLLINIFADVHHLFFMYISVLHDKLHEHVSGSTIPPHPISALRSLVFTPNHSIYNFLLF